MSNHLSGHLDSKPLKWLINGSYVHKACITDIASKT